MARRRVSRVNVRSAVKKRSTRKMPDVKTQEVIEHDYPLRNKIMRMQPKTKLQAKIDNVKQKKPKAPPKLARKSVGRLPKEKQSVGATPVGLKGFISEQYKRNTGVTYMEQIFCIVQKIGEGSYGNVYSVVSYKERRWYAIKVCTRFVPKNRYAEVLALDKIAACDVHNYMNYVNAWNEDGSLYIQFELAAMSLADYAHLNHNICEEQIWQILVDVLTTLQGLHRHELIHMDIKPANILITVDGHYKLCDFGLLSDGSDYRPEGDGKYVSEEILSGRITTKGDIFSVGISMLELAGDLLLPPFGSQWHELRKPNRKSFSKLNKKFSIELENIINWLMASNFDDRPSINVLFNHPDILKHKRRPRINYFDIWQRENCERLSLTQLLLFKQIDELPVTRKTSVRHNKDLPAASAAELECSSQVSGSDAYLNLLFPTKSENGAADEEIPVIDATAVKLEDLSVTSPTEMECASDKYLELLYPPKSELSEITSAALINTNVPVNLGELSLTLPTDQKSISQFSGSDMCLQLSIPTNSEDEDLAIIPSVKTPEPEEDVTVISSTEMECSSRPGECNNLELMLPIKSENFSIHRETEGRDPIIEFFASIKQEPGTPTSSPENKYMRSPISVVSETQSYFDDQIIDSDIEQDFHRIEGDHSNNLSLLVLSHASAAPKVSRMPTRSTPAESSAAKEITGCLPQQCWLFSTPKSTNYRASSGYRVLITTSGSGDSQSPQHTELAVTPKKDRPSDECRRRKLLTRASLFMDDSETDDE